MKQDPKELTRRDATKLVGGALAGAALLPTLLSAQGPTNGKSVFEDSCVDGKLKYTNGDVEGVIYGLSAVWLMLTTFDWSCCFNNETWRNDLAKELNIDPNHVKKLWENVTLSPKNAKLFSDIQGLFTNTVTGLNVYGAPPCPGGKTISNIAALKPGFNLYKSHTTTVGPCDKKAARHKDHA
jgi:hypothetical protein